MEFDQFKALNDQQIDFYINKECLVKAIKINSYFLSHKLTLAGYTKSDDGKLPFYSTENIKKSTNNQISETKAKRIFLHSGNTIYLSQISKSNIAQKAEFKIICELHPELGTFCQTTGKYSSCYFIKHNPSELNNTDYTKLENKLNEFDVSMERWLELYNAPNYKTAETTTSEIAKNAEVSQITDILKETEITKENEIEQINTANNNDNRDDYFQYSKETKINEQEDIQNKLQKG